MANKKLKKVLPITLGAVGLASVAITVPVVLTTKNNSNTTSEINNNQSSSVNNDLDSTTRPSVEESTESNEEISNDNNNQQDQNASENENISNGEITNDSNEVEEFEDSNILAKVIQVKGTENVVFGDEVSFQLTPVLRSNVKYEFKWTVLNTKTNEFVNVVNASSDVFTINTRDLDGAGTYEINGQITRINDEGMELTSKVISKTINVAPKINVSFNGDLTAKNNHANYKISPEISFEGIDEKDFQSELNKYTFQWTEASGKSLSSDLYNGINSKDLEVKLATKSLNLKLIAKSNSQTVSTIAKLTVDAPSFTVGIQGDSSSKKIGSDLNMNADIQSKSRSNDSYTYAWYAKENNSSEPKLVQTSKDANFKLESLSRKTDDNSQYYVVAKNDSTGEVQWNTEPFTVSVENPITDDFKIVPETTSLELGNSTIVRPVGFLDATEINSDNVEISYSWKAWSANQGVELDTNSKLKSINGYKLELQDDGSLKVTNQSDAGWNTQKDGISFQLVVSYHWKDTNGNRKVLGGDATKVIKLTSEVSKSKYVIKKSSIFAIKELAKKLNSSNVKEYLDFKGEVREFDLTPKAQKEIVKSLDLQGVDNRDLSFSLTRTNDNLDKVAYDLELVINNDNFEWSFINDFARNLDNVDELPYSIDGKKLVIKDITTGIFAPISISTSVSKTLTSEGNNILVNAQIKNNIEKQPLSENNFTGINLLLTWYYKDESGNFVKINDVKGVSFANSSDNKIKNQTLSFNSDAKIKADSLWVSAKVVNNGYDSSKFKDEWFSIGGWTKVDFSTNEQE